MTAYRWKFAAIALLMIGAAACRSNHGNNVTAAENVRTSADASSTAHAADKDTAAKR